jgi:hypothetical protein
MTALGLLVAALIAAVILLVLFALVRLIISRGDRFMGRPRRP